MKTLFSRISILVLSVVFAFLMSAMVPISARAAAGDWSAVCAMDGVDANGNAVKVATIQGVQCLLANILSVAVTFIGLAGFVMFLIGSFTYLLSGGNSKGVDSARQTFTFAVIGLVVALSAIIILNLVASFTGVQGILNFNIPGTTSDDGRVGLPIRDSQSSP